MWNEGRGFMAIWSDIVPSDFAFYHDWLLKEHFQERVGVPGFISARVFRRKVGQDFQFFIIYETKAAEVLASAAYVERLNNPSAMTQAIMPKLKNFVRGAGHAIQSVGVCGGGAVKVLRFETSHPALSDPAARTALLSKLAAMNCVLSARVFEVDTEATTIQTEEKKIRTSKEQIYSQLLVIEGTDGEALEATNDALESALSPRGTSAHSYHFIAELQARSLS